jgi:enediyne biosynthesis protein E4
MAAATTSSFPRSSIPVPRSSFFVLAVLLATVACQRPPSPPVEPPAPPPWFEDVTDEVGLHFVHDAGPTGTYFMPQIAGSGAALFDYDNDGRLDILLLTNGGPKSTSTNRLFHQEADGHFKDVSAGSGLDFAGYNMGVAIGDVNNDGFPDVVVTQYGGVKLLLNNGNGTFTDVTKEAGLENNMWGTSAAFVDYDRDGWLDLVIANYVDYDPSAPCLDNLGKQDFCQPGAFPGSVSRLFHNRGRPSNSDPHTVHFEDVTLTSGLGSRPGPGLGVVCADFDGDGWPDLLIANDGQPNRLWLNQHDGTFKEDGTACGLAYNAMGQAHANMGIALGDVNGDGLFDVFITHLTWETHALWVQGPRGRFRDRTVQSDLTRAHWRGTGFGTVFGDFDQDGALDLALVNGRVVRAASAPNPQLGPFWGPYGERNQLFANDGTGRFRDVSLENAPFCGTARVSRGLAVGDVNGDGALDLLVTTLAGPARLYRNVAANRGHWLLLRAVDPALHRDAYGAEITVLSGDRKWVRWVNPASSYLCSNDPRAHVGLGQITRVDAIRVLWPDGSEELFPAEEADRSVVLRKGDGRAAPKP